MVNKIFFLYKTLYINTFLRILLLVSYLHTRQILTKSKLIKEHHSPKYITRRIKQHQLALQAATSIVAAAVENRLRRCRAKPQRAIKSAPAKGAGGGEHK